jgi:hypothetical protein
MFIDQYYSEQDGKIAFTRQQGSDFAKQIADDYNPLHDIDSKRFCVPGDLLFSMVLSRYGLHQQMSFRFSGMVTDEVLLHMPEHDEHELVVLDENDKEYLSFKCDGEHSLDQQKIENLIRCYVEFSGHSFPHILIPLMEEKQVMINPARPMVIYQSMEIDLLHFNFTAPKLELDKDRTVLEANGKKGSICLAFNLTENGEVIGRGEKHMVLSGLRAFDTDAVKAMVDGYLQHKAEMQGK